MEVAFDAYVRKVLGDHGADALVTVEGLHVVPGQAQADSVRIGCQPRLVEQRGCLVPVVAFAALVLAVLLGIPFGVLAATKPDSLLDRLTSVASVSFITMPSFVMGLFLLLLFPIGLGVLPATGTGSFSEPLDYLRHLILPASALAITWVGYFARLVRASMLEVTTSASPGRTGSGNERSITAMP